MDRLKKFDPLFHRAANFISGRIPRKRPGVEALQSCQIIAHRGVHDPVTAVENTIKAFEIALNRGVWGIELDVRWTRDMIPVVFHDPDLYRIAGHAVEIETRTLGEIRALFPLVPTLEAVVDQFGKKMHLMIELKKDKKQKSKEKNRILSNVLAPLSPESDFHFITLTPALLLELSAFPFSAMIPIARLNVKEIVALAMKHRMAGVAGHYFFMTHKTISALNRQGLNAGTGFVDSKNGLYREINRGVAWIFSNRAAAMQHICNAPP